MAKWKNWLKYGFWNTLEHAITRLADAGTSLILLYLLNPEVFSRLAWAQAFIAPFLFFFLAPETVLYRDFAKWKAEGHRALAIRLSALRIFGWAKGGVGLLFAIALTYTVPGDEGWNFHFYTLLWAFTLVLSPQICGTDREFLRLDLRLRSLNLLTIYQKLSLFGGTALASLEFPGRIDVLAWVAILSAVSTAIIAWLFYEYDLFTQKIPVHAGHVAPSRLATLTESLKSFSIWAHLIGIIAGWVQTMDLFFLGLFQYPVREVGFYAAVLKIAAFSMALPLAMTNLFNIWIGRKIESEGIHRERDLLKRLSWFLLLGSAAQSFVIWLFAPWAFEFLSRGRWSPEEQAMMLHWLIWIMAGFSIWSSTFLVSSWLALRSKVSDLCWKVYVPWGLLSVFVYAWAVYFGGFEAAAKANVVISGMYVCFLWSHWVGYKKNNP